MTALALDRRRLAADPASGIHDTPAHHPPAAPVPTMVSIDEATAIVAQHATPLRVERLSLDRAGGRILAEPLVARRAAPEWDVSAMDGYAVRAADLTAGPTMLEVVGETFAGDPPSGALRPGTAIRIFTGAALPRHADRVVLQEDVRRAGRRVTISASAEGKSHVRRAASDFALGDALVAAGLRLTPARLLAAAAGDLAEVTVFARPKVAILATGSELRPPGPGRAGPGAIPESVSYGVAELARAFGADVSVRTILPDDLPRLRSAAQAMTESCDVAVVIGGASVGERDYARAMFDTAGLKLCFQKVAMRPGKPVWFGQTSGASVLGLPGNPGAALFTARLFLAPLLAGFSGAEPRSVLDWRPRTLVTGLEATGALEHVLGGRLAGDDAVAVPPNRDSSAQRALTEIDVLVRRDRHADAVAAGTRVDTLAL